MAMVNMNSLLNGKDSRWLQLEVCREFQRNKCTRPDTECKFAHPPANVEVQNGRVTACYDSIKGRCNREKPPCKYFHPPQHLKDQLLINGRNHLALKNALMQQMGLAPGQSLGQMQSVATNPYLTGLPQVNNAYSPYFTQSAMMPAIMGSADPIGVGNSVGVPQAMPMSQKIPRSDRLEMDSKSFGSYYYEHFAFPGMIPYKRPAGDKSGMPVYQATGATTYQQLMQLPQPFVPISCEYAGTPPLPQTSNQSITSAQNSIQSQASLNVTDVNGVLVDAVSNTPLPTPSGNVNGGVVDKKPMVTHHESDNPRNSPELNNSDSPQINQRVSHTPSSISPMATSMPSVSNLTPMANMSPISNMTSIASIASMHQASMNSMANYTMANMANINVLNSLGMGQCLTSMDPAALAKEVAQKNYAKALKFSQASQQYRMNPLTALSYTGVALNKQAIAMNQNNAAAVAAAAAAASASGNSAQRQIIPAGLTGIHGSSLASTMPAGLLHYPRVSSAASMNPYSLMRQHPILPNHFVQASMSGVPTASAIQQATNPYIHNPYTMLPGMTTMHGVANLSGVPTVVSQMQTGNPATIAAQPQVAIPASTNVIMQPYKKMKTT